jgi:hypothetical protein
MAPVVIQRFLATPRDFVGFSPFYRRSGPGVRDIRAPEARVSAPGDSTVEDSTDDKN